MLKVKLITDNYVTLTTDDPVTDHQRLREITKNTNDASFLSLGTSFLVNVHCKTNIDSFIEKIQNN